MSCNQYDFEIKQGETFIRNIYYTDSDDVAISLVGYTARMQIRKDYDEDVLIELTTENGGITITGASGLIRLEISATNTAALHFNKAKYDLEIINSDTVDRILEGIVTLNKEVTK